MVHVITTSERVYQMLGNENLWSIAKQCDELLSSKQIPYSICGGVAVCLHGYQRNTVDLDLVISAADAEPVKKLLLHNGFEWDDSRREFRTKDGYQVQFLLAGSKAGKGSQVTIAPPTGDLNTEKREGLSVVRLSRLIEMKLACGMGNLRRTHKDFADVVELIDIRKLDGSFARFLHKSVRATYRELVRNATASDE